MSTIVRSNSPQRAASIVSSEKKAGDVVHVEDVTNEVQLERNFSFLSALGLGFSLLNSWTGKFSQYLLVAMLTPQRCECSCTPSYRGVLGHG